MDTLQIRGRGTDPTRWKPWFHYSYVTGWSSLFRCVLHASTPKSFFRTLVPIGNNQAPTPFRVVGPNPRHNTSHRSQTHYTNQKPALLGRKKDFASYMHGTRCIVVGLVACTFHGRAAKSVSTLRLFLVSKALPKVCTRRERNYDFMRVHIVSSPRGKNYVNSLVYVHIQAL